MSFRSQFKATSGKVVEKSIEESSISGSKNEYINLKDGEKLRLRIFPYHPGSKSESFNLRRNCYWLTRLDKEGSYRRAKVADSRMHGGTAMDIVDEFIKFTKSKFSDDPDKMKLFARDSKNSIGLEMTWVCYAALVEDDEPLVPKIWEFKKQMFQSLSDLMRDEEDDSVIELDPFSDPDEGKCILASYKKTPDKSKGETHYSARFPTKGTITRPITDEELEKFSKMPSLEEIFMGYDLDTFEYVLECLQATDEEHSLGVFEEDEWLEIVEKVRSQYSSTGKKSKSVDEDEEEERPTKSTKVTASKTTKTKPVDEDDEDEDDEAPKSKSEDGLDDLDRRELKMVISKESLAITVKKSMSDDDIRSLIRVERAKIEDEDVAEDEEPEEEEAEEKPKKLTKESLKERLKAKMGKK